MHDIANAIMLVGILVFSSHYFTHIFNKTRISDAFFLIVIGLILGPVTGWIVPENTFGQMDEIFTTIALIVILFEGGLELNFRTLGNAFRPATMLAFFNFIGIIIDFDNQIKSVILSRNTWKLYRRPQTECIG